MGLEKEELLIAVLAFFAAPTILWLVSYTLPQLYAAYAPVQNLRKKYGAEWALVTGGGSGIGRALVEALGVQGFNVVIVSLDDDLLKDTVAVMQKMFPKQQFRKVGVNFAPGVDYMGAIAAATKDITVQCVFCNAGYVVTGFLDASLPAKQLANLECNATAAASVAQHFAASLVKGRKRGCIVFTSSAVAYFPSPFSSMYGATKAFVSNLAASMAVELRARGVDVLALHPSPVASNFYKNLDHKIDMMEQAQKAAVPPSALPDAIFRAVGRVVWRDLGAMAVSMRLASSAVSYNALAMLFAIAAPILPDYKQNDAKR